ncbi:ATP-binding protein [Mycoplasmoides gallisepticum]|nr:ATP-binding protein [Mycoplasmoides gallisepticum]
MKKETVINLIRYYTENDDYRFRNEAYEIARAFDKAGDQELAEYIMALLSDGLSFAPQINEDNLVFLKKIKVNGDPLPLPKQIESDLLGIVNALKSGVNKFLFQGSPGTGKTESVKHLARILGRDCYVVDFDTLIDSKLGQTTRNISNLFQEINKYLIAQKSVILFDEIDALALDRTNSRDVREMGRATTSVLKGLDNLDPNVLLIATTNLYNHFDKALTRRFDYIINFNRYEKEDLIRISEILLNSYLPKFKHASSNVRLFKKIISSMSDIPYPGDLKNMIRSSLAFSNPNDEYDYLKRLYIAVNNEGESEISLNNIQDKGFTVREIEILTGISKSKVARELKSR